MYQLSTVTQVFHQRCKEPTLIAGAISGNLNLQDMPMCHLSQRCLACFAAALSSSCTRNRNVQVGQKANNVLKSSFQKKACVENTRDVSSSTLKSLSPKLPENKRVLPVCLLTNFHFLLDFGS